MVTKLVVIVINIPYEIRLVIGYWLGYLYSHQSVKSCLEIFELKFSYEDSRIKVWKLPTK